MKLNIIDTETGEPLVILSEDDRGMIVTGGDPRMVESLGLNKMRDLKEVADHVNQPGSNLQAMFDDEGEASGEQLPEGQQADTGIEIDRIRPALEILKELALKVQRRKEQEESSHQLMTNQAEALNTTDSQVIQDKSEYIYVSLDGDNIGNAIARAEAADDETGLASLSARINSGQQVLSTWARAMGGMVIEAGGDEGLVKVPSTAMDKIEGLRDQYNRAVGATATVGVGRKISESTKARELGKLKGKNQTVVYDESTEKELQLRLEDEDQSETSKIRSALKEPNEPGAPQRVNGDQGERNEEEGEPQEPGQGEDESGDNSDQGTSGSVGESEGEAEPSNDDQAESDEDAPEASSEEEKAPEETKRPAKKVKKAEEPEAKSSLDNRNHDSEIESQDFSDSEDPEFAKRLWYMMKYGSA